METKETLSQDNPGSVFDLRQNDKLTKDIISDISDDILEGRLNPAYAGVVLKRMAKVVEEVYKIPAVKDAIVKETLKYIEGSPKGTKIFGASIIYCATSTNYDYKECGHIVLNELYEIQKEVKRNIDIIEAELKLMIPTKETMETVDGKFGIKDTSKIVVITKMPSFVWESTDDEVKVKPPIKYQGMGLKFMKV